MSDSNRIAATAALLGDPARANMLAALMDGRALTAKELAYAAHVTPQTASGHLAKLADGGLLAAEKQGRHRYYRLASPLVGQMLEGVMAVTRPGTGARHHMAGRRGAAHGAHLLRPSGRPARRGAGRCAERAGPCRAGHGRRRGDGTGPAVSRRLRCIAGAGAARVLPAVSGLERAAAASRRARGRGAGVPVFRAGLDRAAARHARGGDHRRRKGGVSQHIWIHAGRVVRADAPRAPHEGCERTRMLSAFSKYQRFRGTLR